MFFELLAIAALVVVGTRLSIIDVKEHRLPNRLVATLTFLVISTLGGAALVDAASESLLRGIAGGCAYVGLLLSFALVSPRSMGMGDVKLAMPLGVLCGWFGWGYWALGVGGAFVMGALMALWSLVVRRAGAHTSMPFGPAMILAAFLSSVFALGLSLTSLQLA